MRCLKHALFLLALATIGACNSKTAESNSPTNQSPSSSLPAPVTDNGNKEAPKPAPVMAKPTPGTGPSYTLRIKEKAGDKWSYTYNVKTFADPRGMKPDNPQWKQVPAYIEATIEGTVDMVVEGIKDGNFQYRTTNKVTKSVATGEWKQQAEELAKGAPNVVNYTWDERMSNVNIGKGEMYDVLTNSLHTLFPKEPIQVGSTWEYHPIPDATENCKVKVVAAEQVQGINALHLNIAFPATQPGEVNTMNIWIDPENGRYVKVNLDSTANLNGLKSENHLSQVIKG